MKIEYRKSQTIMRNLNKSMDEETFMNKFLKSKTNEIKIKTNIPNKISLL